MIVTTKQLFAHAYGRYAVGAYNINNLEQTVGLFRGNLGKSKSNDDPVNPATSAPFILQISRGARSYTDKRFLEAMIRTADQVFPEVDLRRPPRPRHRRGLLRLHRERLLQLGDDRRLARGVRQERRDHPAGRRSGPCQGDRGRGGTGPARRRRGGRDRQRLPDRSGPGGRVRRQEPAAIRWPWPSAPRTGPTSSPASKGCTSTCWKRSRRRCPRTSRW